MLSWKSILILFETLGTVTIQSCVCSLYAYIAPPLDTADFPINVALRPSFRINQLEPIVLKTDPMYAKLFLKCSISSSIILVFSTQNTDPLLSVKELDPFKNRLPMFCTANKLILHGN